MIKIASLKHGFFGVLLCIIAIFIMSSQLKMLFPFMNPLVLILVGCAGLYTMVQNNFNSKFKIYMFLYFVVLFFNFITDDTYYGLITNVIEEIAIIYFAMGSFIYFAKDDHIYAIDIMRLLLYIFIVYI